MFLSAEKAVVRVCVFHISRLGFLLPTKVNKKEIKPSDILVCCLTSLFTYIFRKGCYFHPSSKHIYL